MPEEIQRFSIVCDQALAAIAFASHHVREEESEIRVTICPAFKSGKWAEGSLELTFAHPFHGLYDGDKSLKDAVEDTLEQNAPELEDCDIIPESTAAPVGRIP